MVRARATSSLELWGGLECTVARIGDRYRDQNVETGHRDRPEDLQHIAALGIRTLRYPIVWETVSPVSPDRCQWGWHDERLGQIRQLGLSPIAGLVHHGSGPHYTHLLDPAFAELLAGHAAHVAQRYPWISLYTPVNEPLTTARFSGLYGHWYPHATCYHAFLRALVNQCWATVLSMRAIRRINPAAQLVQTDDLGRTFSTPALGYQAEHENQRRWLTFDLLCGQVDRNHPWWSILRDHGVGERELAAFLEADCAPDIIGVNQYLTSERFLDGRLGRYPDRFWGGNGSESYADVEAVRVARPGGALGPAARLTEAWERYRRPIAITEAHHGCTREEQLRWLVEVWDAAETVRKRGADVRAVTVWSMFGAVDWNSLLTRDDGIYEPGVFDVRGPSPRPTALARAAAALAQKGHFDHPVLDGPGWWHRETRLYAPARSGRCLRARPARTLLILGDGTPLGQAFSRIARIRGLDHHLVRVGSNSQAVAPNGQVPWAVIDANLNADDDLVRSCADNGIRYLAASTTQVFQTRTEKAYAEDDQPNRQDEDGRNTASAEARLAALCPGALIIRAGPLFGPWSDDNFALRMLHALASGQQLKVAPEIVSPSYLPDLVHTALDLLIDDESGLWHLPNAGSASWWDIADILAKRAGISPPLRAGGTDAMLPVSALTSQRGLVMPALTGALHRFVSDCESDWRRRPGNT